MRADTEVHVAESKRTDLGVSQPRLCRHQKHGAVSPSDPCSRVGRGDERRGLLFREELNRFALMALGWDCQDPLALQRARRLCVRDKAEERAQGGKAGVAGLRRVGALVLQVLEEGAEECRVEVFHAQPGRRPPQAFRGEDQQ